MKCKGKLICNAGAQWLGVLAPSFVVHMEQESKSVPTWLNSFPKVVLTQGKTATEAGLHCTTAHIRELTLFIAFLPLLRTRFVSPGLQIWEQKTLPQHGHGSISLAQP